MTNEVEILSTIRDVHSAMSVPFWKQWDFWINNGIGILGLVASALAYWAASQAEKAATAARQVVKIQSITIELTEIAQKLSGIDPRINFEQARQLLADISWRIHRIVAPFEGEVAFASRINTLLTSVTKAREALGTVKPIGANVAVSPNTVFLAIEGDFGQLNNDIASLCGLFENTTIKFGESNDG